MRLYAILFAREWFNCPYYNGTSYIVTSPEFVFAVTQHATIGSQACTGYSDVYGTGEKCNSYVKHTIPRLGVRCTKTTQSVKNRKLYAPDLRVATEEVDMKLYAPLICSIFTFTFDSYCLYTTRSTNDRVPYLGVECIWHAH